MAAPKQPAQTGGRGRKAVLAAFVAVVAVVAVWLSNCIPGFGLGTSGEGQDGEGERAEPAKSEPAKTEPAKPEPAKPEPPPTTEPRPVEPPPLASAGTTLTVAIGVNGCSVAGSEPIECSKMCERTDLYTGIDDAVLEVTGASQGSVVAMLDCLKTKGIDKVAIRRE